MAFAQRMIWKISTRQDYQVIFETFLYNMTHGNHSPPSTLQKMNNSDCDRAGEAAADWPSGRSRELLAHWTAPVSHGSFWQYTLHESKTRISVIFRTFTFCATQKQEDILSSRECKESWESTHFKMHVMHVKYDNLHRTVKECLCKWRGMKKTISLEG